MSVALVAHRALALEHVNDTELKPLSAADEVGHTVRTRSGAPAVHDATDDASEGKYWYLLEDKGYFLPPIADVNIPTDYMRVYGHLPVQYATDPYTGTRAFWDVGFGEEFFAIGRSNRTKTVRKTEAETGTSSGTWSYAPPARAERWPTGWSLFIDGDMHMLLDFHADSAPVLDSEFRIGGGFMGRGVPVVTEPRSALSHLAWRLKFFHESTHIGDEYLDDIRRREFDPLPGDPPPPTGFIHPNISYLALELLLALDGGFDLPFLPHDPANQRHGVYARVYGGYRRLLSGPYDAGVIYPGVEPNVTLVPGKRDEGQFGAEVELRVTRFRRQGTRPFDYVVVASDTYVRQQYDYQGTLASTRWLSVNTMAGVQWGDWADDQMLFRVLASYYDGINPHGQFRDELLRYWGLTVQIDL